MSESLKIGQIITSQQSRDAIHVAVAPVIAATRLFPGQSVAVGNDATQATPALHGVRVGIVDPYLLEPVEKGQQFWLFLIPGSVTSLAHVWTHPAFEGSTSNPPNPPINEEKRQRAEKWLREFCSSADCPSFEDLMKYLDEGHTRNGSMEWEGDSLIFIGEDAHGEIPNEFWSYWEDFTGKIASERPSYFSCSC